MKCPNEPKKIRGHLPHGDSIPIDNLGEVEKLTNKQSN
jgi:hypothetical protein